jgi:hypothetical protein
VYEYPSQGRPTPSVKGVKKLSGSYSKPDCILVQLGYTKTQTRLSFTQAIPPKRLKIIVDMKYYSSALGIDAVYKSIHDAQIRCDQEFQADALLIVSQGTDLSVVEQMEPGVRELLTILQLERDDDLEFQLGGSDQVDSYDSKCNRQAVKDVIDQMQNKFLRNLTTQSSRNLRRAKSESRADRHKTPVIPNLRARSVEALSYATRFNPDPKRNGGQDKKQSKLIKSRNDQVDLAKKAESIWGELKTYSEDKCKCLEILELNGLKLTKGNAISKRSSLGKMVQSLQEHDQLAESRA